ncbi:DJ-1/PfpI family protein [Sinorhizobium sp. 8-89]|nr:DJ-1/PfpI family protein [Sinorhizobium sp. 7-81]MDK1388820.1 DJ-1/PfpI family protein [Sinorhizobium sp. 7-81]
MAANEVFPRSVRRDQNARLTVGVCSGAPIYALYLRQLRGRVAPRCGRGDRSRPIQCRWKVIAPDLRPITASCGVSVQPQEVFGSPKLFDYIVVVGGLIDEMDRCDERVQAFLQNAAEAGVPLVGLCTGTFILLPV